jgi:hypothetical protein
MENNHNQETNIVKNQTMIHIFRRNRYFNIQVVPKTVNTLVEIVKLIEGVIEDLPNGKLNRSFVVKNDNETYRSDSSEIVFPGGIIDSVGFETVDIYYSYRSDANETNIFASLKQSDSDSFVNIESSNSITADAALKRFEDLISLWESQYKETPQSSEELNGSDDTTVSETRRVKISNVIINLENLRELAKILDESAAKTQTSKYRRKSFIINANDGSTYSSASSTIFLERGILDTKQITSIKMEFDDHNGKMKPSIEIAIEHGDDKWRSFSNYILVKGNDSTWVNGVTRQFENIIAGWEPQAAWPRYIKWLASGLMAIAFSRGVISLLEAIAGRPIQATSLELILVYASLGAFSALPAFLLVDSLLRLWPAVELRTGREYAQLLRKRRTRLGLIVTLVVLPLLMSLLYDLLKWALL